jgi:hypothetical protein
VKFLLVLCTSANSQVSAAFAKPTKTVEIDLYFYWQRLAQDLSYEKLRNGC